MTSRIRAQAIVDVLRRGLPGLTKSDYRVTVRGETTLGLPLPARIYDVTSVDQDAAATFCLGLFTTEFDPPWDERPHALIH